jgi:hypothetical protein
MLNLGDWQRWQMHSTLNRDQAGSIPASPTRVCRISLRDWQIGMCTRLLSETKWVRSPHPAPDISLLACGPLQPKVQGIRIANLNDDFYREQEDDGQACNRVHLQARRSCKGNRESLVPVKYRALFREQKTLQKSGSEKSENLGVV